MRVMNVQKKHGLKICLLALVCWWAFASVTWAAMVTVTGQGSSERGAIKAALRQAIEQQIGVMVDSRSYVQNYKLINDRVYTQADGYIRSYKVLEHNVVNGIHSAKVQVDVQEQKLTAALGTLAQKKAVIGMNMQDPRIGVLAMDRQGRAYPAVENNVINGLTSQGFSRVVDMGQISTSKRRQLLAAQYSQDRKLWQSLNIQSPVDYLVTAQVDLAVNSMADYVPMPGMANLKKAAASIAVRMVNANTGEVIYAGNFRGKSERRSNNAENEAINAASAGIAKAIGEAALNKAANPSQHITLVITQNKWGNIADITNYLENIPGVNHAYVRATSFGNTTVDLEFNGTAHDLAAALEADGQKIVEMGSEYVKI